MIWGKSSQLVINSFVDARSISIAINPECFIRLFWFLSENIPLGVISGMSDFSLDFSALSFAFLIFSWRGKYFLEVSHVSNGTVRVLVVSLAFRYIETSLFNISVNF